MQDVFKTRSQIILQSYLKQIVMSTTRKTVEDYFQLHQRNALAHVVRTSVRLGIIQALSVSQKTVAQLAAELNLNASALEQLMNVLASTELVEKYGDDYALSALARLIPEAFLDLGDRYWKNLDNYIKTGGTEALAKAQPNECPAQSGSIEADFHNHKASEEWLLTPLALDAIEVLDIGKSRRGLRVLEIGSGSAVFAAALAHRDADSVINLLDTKQGLIRAKRTVEEIGIERQTELIEAEDISRLDVVEALKEQQFDLVILAGLLHRWNRQKCRTFLAAVKDWIRPDRELAIIDIFPGQAQGDQLRSVFELELGLRTNQGQLHDPTELKVTLEELGYRNVQYAHLPSAPWCWGLMLAERDG